jgi:glutathione synthase/RimK-type ligase-like ATP-grasp enzyme
VSRVAIATCTGNDLDPDAPVLMAALEAGGVDASLAIWDDESVNWEDFDLVVIRSTWDYVNRRDEFLRWARTIPHLLNPYGVIEYSTDKHYLRDLEAHGLRIVPSRFCDVGEEPTFFDSDFVVKPCVGAGSMDASRYTKDDVEVARRHVDSLHAKGRDVLIQPYIDSVDSEGERALVFIDGAFSHAMTKAAMLNVTELDRNGLFRLDQMTLAAGEPDAVLFGEKVLSAKGFSHLLYGRVDLVRTNEGWAIMELELVEPSLFLTYDDGAATKLTNAIAQRLH